MSLNTKPDLAGSSLKVDMAIDDDEFAFISHMVGRNAGIVLGPGKRQLVQGRVARRIRELGLPSFAAYCEQLRQSGPEELVALINALTTNVTSFFRESHHFEALAEWMLPEALSRNASTRKIRIWSAGCSSGEEAWSIAMTVAEQLPAREQWDIKILATDIDSDVLATAALGVYPVDRLGGIPEDRLRRWLLRGAGPNGGRARIKDELKALVAFRPLNLMDDWPMRGPFDVIFCRNVMIYFDSETREKLAQRFSALLPEGGCLCIGHSESLRSGVAPLAPAARTVYRRTQGPR